MYIHNFSHKLRKLNDSLYIRTDTKKHVAGDWYAVAIQQRGGERKKRNFSNAKLNYGNKYGGADYLREVYAGNIDKFIMGCPAEWVPEYTVFHLDTGEIVARGWRAILLQLAKQKLVSLDKAKKVFNCYSLGNSDYDLMSTGEKLQKAREEFDA